MHAEDEQRKRTQQLQ